MESNAVYSLVSPAPKFEFENREFFEMNQSRNLAEDEIEVELPTWKNDSYNMDSNKDMKTTQRVTRSTHKTSPLDTSNYRRKLTSQSSSDARIQSLLERDTLSHGNPEDDWQVNGTSGYSSRSCLRGRRLVFLSAACSSLCSVLLGYDVGVMSGAKEYIQPDLSLSDNQTAVIVGSLNLVSAAGALIAGRAADTVGRRYTIALACSVFIVGAFVMAVSPGFLPLLLGRIVTGIGVGSAMMVAPIYIAELSPPNIRGALVSLTDVSINFGILLGYAGSIFFDEVLTDDGSKWRAMIGFGAIPPALVLLCLIFMPESPRWLIAQGDSHGGFNVLHRILNDSKLAKENYNEMTQSVALHTKELSWRDVLFPTDGAIKAAVGIGLGLGFWQQASGSEAAVYYSPEVLSNSGWNGRSLLLANVAVGLFKLSGEVIAFFFLDKVGRRPLLIISALLSTVFLFGLSMAFFNDAGGSTVLSLLCIFMLCFSLGLGPVTFVVASEIFPLTVRGKAMALVVFINRMLSGTVALCYTAMAKGLTPGGSFLVFTFLSAGSAVFYYKCVPETSNKTLEQITAELEVTSAVRLAEMKKDQHVSHVNISRQRDGINYL